MWGRMVEGLEHVWGPYVAVAVMAYVAFLLVRAADRRAHRKAQQQLRHALDLHESLRRRSHQ